MYYLEAFPTKKKNKVQDQEKRNREIPKKSKKRTKKKSIKQRKSNKK
jgi:hypothetical protein